MPNDPPRVLGVHLTREQIEPMIVAVRDACIRVRDELGLSDTQAAVAASLAHGILLARIGVELCDDEQRERVAQVIHLAQHLEMTEGILPEPNGEI